MLTDLCFDASFPAMKSLDLSSNKVAYFSTDTVNHLNRVYNSEETYLSINLLGNPLACDCRDQQAIDFVEWMLHPPNGLHFLLINDYTCTSPTAGVVSVANITRLQIVKWKKYCWPNVIEQWLKITFSCVSAITFVFSLIFLYNKRWLIKYKWFKFTK